MNKSEILSVLTRVSNALARSRVKGKDALYRDLQDAIRELSSRDISVCTNHRVSGEHDSEGVLGDIDENGCFFTLEKEVPILSFVFLKKSNGDTGMATKFDARVFADDQCREPILERMHQELYKVENDFSRKGERL